MVIFIIIVFTQKGINSITEEYKNPILFRHQFGTYNYKDLNTKIRSCMCGLHLSCILGIIQICALLMCEWNISLVVCSNQEMG
jgi:hypothetical protein